MRARSHSGRRARGGIPTDGVAGEFDETGGGMDAAFVVIGVSGINSAMGNTFQHAAQTERPRLAILFSCQDIYNY